MEFVFNSTTKMVSKARAMFYLIGPGESRFATVESVPDYVNEATPFFLFFVVMEQILLTRMGKRKMRWNDGLVSMSSGLLMRTSMLLVRHLEILAYIWTYDNLHIVSLPWNSAWTWWFCFFGVDLGYYWFHRLAHEVNFMWAAHQVHHSSEDYNLSTALRQSAFQQWTSWMFYLPMALFIPPSVFLVHIQFNLLYQFWIHTEVIRSLGPLEFILNTPSHHRVHHGRNRYCIDKNYAGTLIIWDRIFGTFEAEDEEVVYGLTHPLESFNPIWVQMFHYINILKGSLEATNLGHKLSVILKGPGWYPGTQRLGDPNDIPDVKAPVKVYNPKIPAWQTYLMVVQFLFAVICNQEVYKRHLTMSQTTVAAFMGYIILSLTAIGSILDKRNYGPILNLISNVVFLAGQHELQSLTFLPSPYGVWLLNVLRIYSISLTIFWAVLSISSINKRKKNQ